MIIPVEGETPGRRYGHSLNFRSPYLILFGGNDGKNNLKDVFILNVQSAPFMWNKVDT